MGSPKVSLPTLMTLPRALFYRTDCTRRSKFLTHALHIWNSYEPINEEALRTRESGEHGLSQEIKNNEERNQITLFHHGIECLATFRSGLDFFLKGIKTHVKRFYLNKWVDASK